LGKEINFEDLKTNFQAIMNLIAIKNYENAHDKLLLTKEIINEMIDHSKKDSELIAISKYQILWKKLQMQLENLN